MAKAQGTALRLYWNTNTYASPTYTSLDCEVESTLTINNSEIDVTGKCSSNWKELLGTGIRDWSLSVSGHYAEGDTAIDRARTDIITNNTMLKMQWKTFNSEVFSGDGQITSFEMSSPHDNVVGFSANFVGSGALAVA